MEIILVLLVAGTIAGLAASSCTRSAKIARMAKTNGCRFDREKDSVTTELTAGRLEFFTLFFHQYQNVCTCSDDLAFIRMADDTIYQDDKPTTKPHRLSIFTAELKKRQFPALKIAPVDSPLAPSQYALMKTNIPAVDARYRIHAPTPAAALVLTPFIIGLLKTRGDIYLELNENALVYHENKQIPLTQWLPFRFRALQILHEFENIILKLDAQDPTNTNTSTATLFPKAPDEAEARAEAMIKALCSPQTPAGEAPQKSWRGVWILVMLLLLLGISLLTWFVLNNANNLL